MVQFASRMDLLKGSEIRELLTVSYTHLTLPTIA